MPRLPQPGSDDGTWGAILNDYLTQSHTPEGTLKDDVVGTAQLQANSITTPTLTDGAVTESKLSSGVQTKLNSSTATNLSANRTATSITVVSDTGTDATLATADGSNAGILTAADKTKLDGIEASAQVNDVNSVAGKTGTVTLVKGDVGLGSVDNTSDAGKPVSTATQAALDGKENTTNKGTAGGYAGLDGGGKVPAGQLPTTDSISEGSANLYFTNARASTAAPVQSVAGKTGVVSLVKGDVGLGNVDNTADANKPISTATQAALDGKANITESVSTVASAGASQTLVARSVATIHDLTLTSASCAITMPAPTAGASITVILRQDATGNRLVAWDATVKWPGEVVPTLTATPSKGDLFGFICINGTQWIGLLAGQAIA